MPYVIDLRPDERLVTDIFYQPSRKVEPFRFAVSDQAVYLPAKKFVVSGDPTYFERVPLGEVSEVTLQPIKPYGAYLGAAVMIGPGLFCLWSFVLPGAGLTPRGLGWSLAILVGGLLLPFSARGRHRLLLRYGGKTFRWTPPYVVGGAARLQVDELLDQIVHSLRDQGVRIDDSGKTRV